MRKNNGNSSEFLPKYVKSSKVKAKILKENLNKHSEKSTYTAVDGIKCTLSIFHTKCSCLMRSVSASSAPIDLKLFMDVHNNLIFDL